MNNIMKRRDFLKAAGAAGIGFALAPRPGRAAQSSSRPNFVIVYADDLGWTDVSYNGSDYYETPHIDRLAADGVVFTDAYAGAPNCSPSRACLITGNYAPRGTVSTTSARSTPAISASNASSPHAPVGQSTSTFPWPRLSRTRAMPRASLASGI